ncbi:hypothetical protein TA3x_002348 [Tundrisphaera sp. TA3]|uniref:hypothetical protein n=1 Tax=Tundrisphaera sp. TA3 TaxID=3435775 RepID=UPI003EB9FF7E
MDDEPSGGWNLRIDWDGPAVRAWLWRHRVAILLGLGALFRVAQYLAGRSLWLDEQSLRASVRVASPLAFFGPLGNGQLAPPGFLLLQWLAVRAIGDSSYGVRFVPLLAGLAGLWLFLEVARRVLAPRAVPAAAALFASADDLIYFAAEGKQYSSDVAAALACTLLGLTAGAGRLTPRRAAILAGFGVLIVWFSHPSVFVLAAVGTARLAGRILVRDWPGAAAWCGIGAAWVASFAAVHHVAMDQLGHEGMMWEFWAFAFPPAPRSAWDASWIARRLAYVLVNPLHFREPFGPGWSMIPALLCGVAGFAALWRSGRDRLAILTLPIAFAAAASGLRLYPFHGRLILFLVPAFLLLIAAGLDRSRDLRPGRPIVFALLATLLIGVPMLRDAFHLVEPRDRMFFNTYGDRRPPSDDPGRFPF